MALCRTIAEQPRMLNAFADAHRSAGAVGEERNGKLLYLALTCRFLPRPVSAAVKGPSSGGMSFSVETVVETVLNETRLLSLHVTDTWAQTREAMRAIAHSAQADFDPAPWIALQQWIARGEHRVEIPFAPALAELRRSCAFANTRHFSAAKPAV